MGIRHMLRHLYFENYLNKRTNINKLKELCI